MVTVYSFHPELVPGYVQGVLSAMSMTVYLLAYSLLFGLAIGFLLALAQVRGSGWMATVAHGYVSFMRGVPSLVMILMLFMGLPQVMDSFGVDMSNVAKSAYIVVALSLLSSANLGEMMRSSYLAVDHGQTEAALSVGMTERQALGRIVLPQAVAVAVPNFGNSVIGLFKETSLAFSIGTLDLMGKAQAIMQVNYGSTRLEVYLAVAIIYWACCLALQLVFAGVERVTTRGRGMATG